jgi:hypothetical protein
MIDDRTSSSGGGGFSAAGWVFVVPAPASFEPAVLAGALIEPAASSAAKSKDSMDIGLFSFLFVYINEETWL